MVFSQFAWLSSKPHRHQYRLNLATSFIYFEPNRQYSGRHLYYPQYSYTRFREIVCSEQLHLRCRNRLELHLIEHFSF